MGKDKIVIKPWTIYLWRRGDKMEGASPVVTKDGIKQVYCQGWEIEKVPGVQRNEDRHQAFRARVNVKNMLNNTLNVLNWYGKKIVDDQGNVDTEKLKGAEMVNALLAVKQNVDISDLYPIRKFPSKDITVQEALDYGFIGNLIQNKFIDKNY